MGRFLETSAHQSIGCRGNMTCVKTLGNIIGNFCAEIEDITLIEHLEVFKKMSLFICCGNGHKKQIPCQMPFLNLKMILGLVWNSIAYFSQGGSWPRKEITDTDASEAKYSVHVARQRHITSWNENLESRASKLSPPSKSYQCSYEPVESQPVGRKGHVLKLLPNNGVFCVKCGKQTAFLTHQRLKMLPTNFAYDKFFSRWWTCRRVVVRPAEVFWHYTNPARPGHFSYIVAVTLRVASCLRSFCPWK